MSSLNGTDHIIYILVAFVAVLGCFTACALVGVDATVIGTLRDILLALGGALGGVAVANKLGTTATVTDEETKVTTK